jgi:tetratricopeptide (TPR) repeat protein
VEPSVESDPQAWPALADAHRRAGRLDEARKVAEEGLQRSPEDLRGRVALALTLLDGGQPDAARNTLTRVFADEPESALADEPESEPDSDARGPFAAFAAVGAGGAPNPDAVTGVDVEALAAIDELEVENAFEAAEARTDEMHNANHLAEAALHSVESGAPEGVWAPETESPFATQTVADLLERQGHAEPARDLREGLLSRGALEHTAANPNRQRTLATLERWLGNLRRAAS